MVEDGIPPLDGAIVNSVVLVDRITRTIAGPFEAVSLPGHLIHITTEGEVEQRAGGVVERFGPGCAIWYYENEPVQGVVKKTPWSFYTVNFRAVALLPPPLDRRVVTVSEETVARMQALLEVWRDTQAPPARRHMRVHALLLEIVLDVLPDESQAHRMDTAAGLWWRIEAELRKDLSRAIDLRFLQRLGSRSQRGIFRACHLATGMPPMKRVKHVRLSYARGLVQLSELTMSEIACRVGYGRVQEFSRDYGKLFAVTPTQDRNAGPDYRRHEV